MIVAMQPLLTSIGLGVSCVLWCATAGHGQDLRDNPWFVRVGFLPSYVLPTDPFFSSANATSEPIRWGQNATIELGRQTNGSRAWHWQYGLPAYGVGFSMAWFSNHVEIGRPLEAYAFFSWPFVQMSERLDLTSDFG